MLNAIRISQTILIVFLFLNLNCQDKPFLKTNIPPQYESENTSFTVHFYSESELKQLWDSLCLKKGCLTGGQYVGENGIFGIFKVRSRK